jgi:hypothetical protein
MANKQLPPPLCLALILCDYVHVDPGSGKQTIIGTFSEVAFDGFPAAIPQLCIYFCLTEGYGKIPIQVRVIDVNEERPPIFDVTEHVEFASPKDAAQHSLHIRGMPFNEPGQYRVQLFAGGEFLMDRLLRVVGV